MNSRTVHNYFCGKTCWYLLFLGDCKPQCNLYYTKNKGGASLLLEVAWISTELSEFMIHVPV